MAIWSKVYIVRPVYDGSTDGTAEVLSQLSAIHPELLVIRKENGGHGPAVMDGYRAALSDSPDFINFKRKRRPFICLKKQEAR